MIWSVDNIVNKEQPPDAQRILASTRVLVRFFSDIEMEEHLKAFLGCLCGVYQPIIKQELLRPVVISCGYNHEDHNMLGLLESYIPAYIYL